MVVDSVPTMMDLPQSVVDPRSLGNLPIADTSGVPAFPQVRAAIALARRIGVEPTCERVRALESVADNLADNSDIAPAKKRKLIDRLDKPSGKFPFDSRRISLTRLNLLKSWIWMRVWRNWLILTMHQALRLQVM